MTTKNQDSILRLAQNTNPPKTRPSFTRSTYLIHDHSKNENLPKYLQTVQRKMPNFLFSLAFRYNLDYRSQGVFKQFLYVRLLAYNRSSSNMLAKQGSYRHCKYFLLIPKPFLICVNIRGVDITTHTSAIPKMAQDPPTLLCICSSSVFPFRLISKNTLQMEQRTHEISREFL